MKLYEHRDVSPGEIMYRNSLIWSASDRDAGLRRIWHNPDGSCTVIWEPVDVTMAGINIPIPVPFWHYRLDYNEERYGMWMLTLAIRRDDRPIRDGFLPRIEAGCWLSWRKPLSPLITKMLKALPFGNVRNCIQSCENTFTTSQTVATGASEKPPE